jgi:hypothetical protein
MVADHTDSPPCPEGRSVVGQMAGLTLDLLLKFFTPSLQITEVIVLGFPCYLLMAGMACHRSACGNIDCASVDAVII